MYRLQTDMMNRNPFMTFIFVILLLTIQLSRLEAQTPALQTVPACGNSNSTYGSLVFTTVACYTGSGQTVALNLTGTQTLVIKSGANITFSSISIASSARLFIEAGATVRVTAAFSLSGTIVNYGNLLQSNMANGVSGLTINNGAKLYNENTMTVGGVFELTGTSFTIVNGGNMTIGYKDYYPTDTYTLTPLISLCHLGCTYTGIWTLRPGSIIDIIAAGVTDVNSATGAIGAPGACVTSPAGGLFQYGTSDISGNNCTNKARINYYGTVLSTMPFVAPGYGATNYVVNNANIVLVGYGSATGDPTAGGCPHVPFVGPNTLTENSGTGDPRLYVTTNTQSPLPLVPFSYIDYCQGGISQLAANDLSTATALTWYTSATGTTGKTTTAPTPTTTNGTSPITYYVSQTVNGCEGPRAPIYVTVNSNVASPTSISVSGPLNVCIGGTISLTGPNSYNAYSWTGPAFYSSTTQNPTVTTSADTTMAGTYTLVVTQGSGGTACNLNANTTTTVGPWPTPTSSAATGITCSQFTANWSPTSANSYSLEVSTSSTFASVIFSTLVTNTTSRNITSLTAGTTYYYRVRTIVSGCASGYSAIQSATTTSAVSTPVFTLGNTSSRCQSAGTVSYDATASNTSGAITYTLDAASLAGGNAINSSTGLVTYSATWSGTSTVTASAPGCNGPTTATHTITTTSTPVISVTPTSGLLAHYKLDGNAADATNTNPGTLQLGPIPIADRFGYANRAYSFDGSSQYITTTVQYNNPTIFTISTWFNTSTTTGGRLIGFGNSQTGSSGNIDRAIYMSDDGKLYFGVYNAGTFDIHSPLSYNDGDWHLVTATFSGTNGMRLYVDGVQVASNPSYNVAQNYSGYWRIAWDYVGTYSNNPTSNYFKGSLDDILIYNTELTSADVTLLYSSSGGAGSNSPVCNNGTLNLTSATISGANYSWTGPNGFTSTSQNPSVTNMSSSKEGTYTVTVTSGGCTVIGDALGKINISLGPDLTQIPTTGLISDYKLDGNASDATKMNPGFLQNAPTPTTDRFGNTNSAYSFNGSNQFITTSVRYNNPTIFTISTWFNTTTNTGGKLIGFGNSQSSGSGAMDRHIYMDNAGKIYFGIYNTATNTINSTLSYNDGNWHLVTATFSGTNGMRLYMDGTLVASNASYNVAQNYSGYWRIAYDNVFGYPNAPTSPYFKGKLDDVLIYNTELTSSDVTSIYSSSGGAGSNALVCAGSTLNLTATTIAGASYSWTGPNGFTSNLQNPSISNVSALNAGSYGLSVNGSGCISTGQTNVQILAAPAAAVGTGASICGTGTVNLSASGSPTTYNWYSNSTGGVSLATTSSYTTPTISSTSTYYVTSVGSNGCESSPRTSVVATINPIPSAPSVTNGSNCGTGTVNLSASGSPGTYNWYAASSGGSSLATTANYTTPSISTTTNYYVTSVSAGCESTPRTLVVATINSSIPSAPTVTNGSNCGTGTVTLSASGSPTTYNWYSAASGGSSLATTNTFTTPSISSTTTYYVSSVSAANCESARTAVVATINPIPSAPTVSNGSNCGTGTVVLSASGSTGSYNWYSGSSGGSSLATTSNFTTPSITSTTTYYVSSVSAANCESARTAVVATINPIPSAPTGTGGSNCGTGTVALSATGSPSSYNWYSASSGGSSLATTANFTTPSITATTTYYVSSVSAANCESARTSVVATINTIPSAPTGTAGSNCGTGTVALSASGSPGSYNWYNGSSGGSSLATTANFTTPSITSTTTYYVSAVNTDNCESARTAVVATINPVPADPTSNNMERCGPGSIILTANGSPNSYNWYDSTSHVTLSNSTSNFTTPILNSSTHYYISSVSLEGCESNNKYLVQAIVHPIPVAPTGADVERCDHGSVTLIATGSIGSYNWYDISNGGTSLSTTANFTSPILSSTTTYYVTSVSAEGCESTRTALNAIVNQTPSSPSTSDVIQCGPGSVLLTASGSPGSYHWYANSTGGSSLAASSSYNTSTINTDTSFFVSSFIGNCESNRTEVKITITPPSLAGTLSSDSSVFCANQNAGVVSLLGNKGSVTGWLTSSDNFKNDIHLNTSTDSSLSFSNLAGSIYYKSIVKNGGCPADTTQSYKIQIDPITEPGVLIGNQINEDEITLSLSGQTGSILYYETSKDSSFINKSIVSATNPYLTVSNNNKLFYRAVVRSGVCNLEYTNSIELDTFMVYHTISPNGDGLNDTWTIPGIYLHPHNKVSIFDRWGSLVYYVEGYDNNQYVWSGECNTGLKIDNHSLSEGTYFYSIEIGKKRIYTGFVELRR